MDLPLNVEVLFVVLFSPHKGRKCGAALAVPPVHIGTVPVISGLKGAFGGPDIIAPHIHI